MTEFPTCPQCLQMFLELWELVWEADRAPHECENCGAVLEVRRGFECKLIKSGKL